ncbi:glutamate-cysteine ligase family protein [Natronoglomus mannanivorans]|uniref:Glutamate-cysteine ligase family protein n=1 Tax=Natronoglomus mannanivorans TaxID=2979990 RepID=A0AAP2Z2E0_9EURY|nr:glutamate-cysteine ligase family protein [Halobacteria archaeon AArc-xg1-1]
MKTSLEVEYWVVTEDGDLTDPGSLLDSSEQIDAEFVEPMLEIKTTPCETHAELRDELYHYVGHAVDAAREQGKRLVPLGTPLDATPRDIPYRENKLESTDLQREIIGPAFDNARFCAGTHVHFEQSNVVDQLNALTAIDPSFALVNSASHHRGTELTTCARPFLYRSCCYEHFPQQGQLWPYVDSVDEWEARLETAFETYREAARMRGIDPTTVEEQYDPYDAVWTPVRLRDAFPTVEWRSPDTALPEQVLELTRQVRSVVERADEFGVNIAASDGGTERAREKHNGTGIELTSDRSSRQRGYGPITLPSFETVERTVQTAIHEGCSDPAVESYLRELGFDPTRLDPLADRHRDGPLSRRRARKLRLRAADRLEAEVRRATVRV